MKKTLVILCGSIFSCAGMQAQNVGIGTTTPVAKLHVADSNVVFTAAASLPATAGNSPAGTAGTYLLWYADKAAFRAGTVNGNHWDKNNTGNYSFASGYNTKATGFYAAAMGTNTIAAATGGTALGNQSQSNGDYSLSGGSTAIAWGRNAIAFGNQAAAYGDNAVAFGINTISQGYQSFATGNTNYANGDNSVSTGIATVADGNNSFTSGADTHASGYMSFAGGASTYAKAYNGFTVGMYNDITDNPPGNLKALNDRIFQVGNGLDASSRSNALTIIRSGEIGIGTATPNANLQFSNNLTNRKMVLYEAQNNDHQFYGIGLNSGVFRYQVDAAVASHVFYAGLSNTSSRELMRITGTGFVGIGNAAPSRPLSFPAQIGEKILLYPGPSGEVGIGVYGNELRLHCDNPGSTVSFGTQDNAGNFTQAGRFQINGAYALYVNGSIWANGTTYASDERFKQNITPITSPLQKLTQINGVEYEMKTDAFAKNHFQPGRQIGLLAQNVEKVVPEAVKELDGYKGVDYARLVPLLIEGMKEQQQQIETLKKELALLKNATEKNK